MTLQTGNSGYRREYHQPQCTCQHKSTSTTEHTTPAVLDTGVAPIALRHFHFATNQASMLSSTVMAKKISVVGPKKRQEPPVIDAVPVEPGFDPESLSPLMRLQQAALGVGEVLPSDVTAMLAKIALQEAGAVNKMAEEADQLKAMLLAEKPSSPASAEAIMDLLDRFAARHLQRQGELRKSLELLHRLASPPVRPTVNVLSVTPK